MSRRSRTPSDARLKEIVKRLDPKGGGIIVRTAAEGASAEDIERDLVFLQRLWKTIQANARGSDCAGPVRGGRAACGSCRDLFVGDFVGARIDDDRTYRRIVSYLKKTSPHMVERVHRYRDKEPIFEASGIDAEIRSTLDRRVDLPSGGYLVFDYAEAFTVIDVNTGRFVGSRGKSARAASRTRSSRTTSRPWRRSSASSGCATSAGSSSSTSSTWRTRRTGRRSRGGPEVRARAHGEDVRRRDLPARARRDDPSERDRRPREILTNRCRLVCEGPASWSRTRRTHSRSSGSCGDREGLSRPGVQGRGAPTRARAPRGTGEAVSRSSTRSLGGASSSCPRPGTVMSTSTTSRCWHRASSTRCARTPGRGGWHRRAEARRGRPLRPVGRRGQAGRRTRGRRRRGCEARRQEGDGHRRAQRSRGAAFAYADRALRGDADDLRGPRSSRATRASRANSDVVVAVELEPSDEAAEDAGSRKPNREASTDEAPKKRTRRGPEAVAAVRSLRCGGCRERRRGGRRGQRPAETPDPRSTRGPRRPSEERDGRP